MTADERFFWCHASYSHDPTTETRAEGRRRCARVLVEAETWARDTGLTFEWDFDSDADLSWCARCEHRRQFHDNGSRTACPFGPRCRHANHEHELFICTVRYASGKYGLSLGSVDLGSGKSYWGRAPYCRVIEAELAAEARDEIQRSAEHSA